MPLRPIREATDVFAHTNPSFVALCLHWLCAGYETETVDRADPSRYLAIPWAITGLALIGPSVPRAELPGNGSKKLTLLIDEHPHWRAALPEALKEWSGPFWRGAAFAVATGVLSLQDGRLRAADAPKKPGTDSERDLRKRGVALGKVLAHEGSDKAISAALGLEIHP